MTVNNVQQLALGFLALGLVYCADTTAQGGPCSINSTCSMGCEGSNRTCSPAKAGCLENGTCAESRLSAVPCASENCTTIPADGTSRLLPGVTVASNVTSEKPLSKTTHFSPSPFLGVIPEQPGSLVVGEVFQDTVGPRHKTFSFPNRQVSEYAHSRDTYREYPLPSVEIHVGPPATGYDRPDYDNAGRPYGKPEVDIAVPIASYNGPEEEVKPSFPKPEAGLKSHSGNLGKLEYTNNHVDFNSYPDSRPKQPYYEGYENMKNLLKPVKSLPPYQFEPSFGFDKPIHEDNGEANHYSLSYPGVAGGPPAAFSHLPEAGEHTHSKLKSILRFVATVLPFGLLLAALSPNILVISPADDGDSTAKNPGHRSLPVADLEECGLRKLCEALSSSPQDYEVFLRAAQQGSTPELQDIIKKAEEKNCSALGCLKLKPTESTVR